MQNAAKPTNGEKWHTLCTSYSAMLGMDTDALEDSDLKRVVGRRIADARRARGWSQRELAQTVGMAPSTIGGYEQGYRLPRPQEATLLGQALDVSPAHLLVLEGDDMLLLDAEAELVRKFRALPPEEQQRFRKLLEGRAKLAQLAPTKKRPPPKR